MIATVIGNIRPAAKREYIAARPAKWYRARTKLAITPSTTTPTVVAKPTIAELPICSQKVELRQHVDVVVDTATGSGGPRATT